jgi:predicted  nucleic acid-binding Zn-ribbon protein
MKLPETSHCPNCQQLTERIAKLEEKLLEAMERISRLEEERREGKTVWLRTVKC